MSCRRHCWHFDPYEDDPDYCCRCGFDGFADTDTQVAVIAQDQRHHALCRNPDALCRVAEARAEEPLVVLAPSSRLKHGPPNWQWEQDWSEFWPELDPPHDDPGAVFDL
jgi:hypothetical protein